MLEMVVNFFPYPFIAIDNNMPTLNGSYILKPEGVAPTGVYRGKVFALLIEKEYTEKWVITPVSEGAEDVLIQTSDRSKAWTVPSDGDLVQIAVEDLNSDSPAPNQIFRIVWPEPDSGYIIQLLANTSGKVIGRNFVEDRSLGPKPILTLQKGLSNPKWWVVPA